MDSFLTRGLPPYVKMRFMKNICNFKYAGAMVLGMHDALVEITGIIAGLIFAIDNRRILLLTGAIAAVAASLSMAAANYMAQRTDNNPDAPIAATYTGATYVTTSAILLAPFCVIHNRFAAFGTMCIAAVAIILLFNLCIGKINKRPFWSHFWEMLCVCIGVSIASFAIGQAAKYFLNIQI